MRAVRGEEPDGGHRPPNRRSRRRTSSPRAFALPQPPPARPGQGVGRHRRGARRGRAGRRPVGPAERHLPGAAATSGPRLRAVPSRTGGAPPAVRDSPARAPAPSVHPPSRPGPASARVTGTRRLVPAGSRDRPGHPGAARPSRHARGRRSDRAFEGVLPESPTGALGRLQQRCGGVRTRPGTAGAGSARASVGCQPAPARRFSFTRVHMAGMPVDAETDGPESSWASDRIVCRDSIAGQADCRGLRPSGAWNDLEPAA